GCCARCGSDWGCGRMFWGAYADNPPGCNPCDNCGNFVGGCGNCGNSRYPWNRSRQPACGHMRSRSPHGSLCSRCRSRQCYEMGDGCGGDCPCGCDHGQGGMMQGGTMQDGTIMEPTVAPAPP